MKITEMLQREDFYKINMDTLREYYGDGSSMGKLYIYPKLNAIVTQKPSKAVIEYLLTEYDVQGSAVKRLAVQSYVKVCLSSNGRMADKQFEIPNTANSNTLIYPCNRKYRIFNFNSNVVDVQIKSGFPTGQLEHEVEFRKKDSIPDFVPKMLRYSDYGYREQIIDGRPLARISDGYEEYKKTAYNKLMGYTKQFEKKIPGYVYAEDVSKTLSGIDYDTLKLLGKLTAAVSKIPEITLTFSHGDLQAGNIWIENGTNKVFIIDWESWGTRSVFYDKAVLFDGLRPGNIDNYLSKKLPPDEMSIVLLEDFAFKIEEYKSLPGEFGKEQLDYYVKKVTEWSNRVISRT